jgi:hypothetical protein
MGIMQSNISWHRMFWSREIGTSAVERRILYSEGLRKDFMKYGYLVILESVLEIGQVAL